MFLGNNADEFMTKKMPISVTTQEGRATEEMAAPRDTTRVGVNRDTVDLVEPQRASMPSSFLPGIGSDAGMLPGMGADNEMLPGMGNFMDRLLSPTGLLITGGALYWLFATKSGKRARKSLGMG